MRGRAMRRASRSTSIISNPQASRGAVGIGAFFHAQQGLTRTTNCVTRRLGLYSVWYRTQALTTMGRPREFELDGAIEKATGLFWQNGYEGTSLSDLTTAIGISPPSFYFAFGSKEGLFRKVIERYFAEQNKLVEAAFRKPTPRAVVMHFLRGYAEMLTDPLHAPGCLALNSSLPCSAGDPLRAWLADMREQTRIRFRDRFAEARGAGSPVGMDADDLARLVMVTAWGLAVEAQSGATRKELRRTVALALPAWPDTERSNE